MLNQNEASFEELLSGLRLFIEERNDLTIAGKTFIIGILDAMPAAISNSKQAKKAALFDKIMAHKEDPGCVVEENLACHYCEWLTGECEDVYDAIEKDGKP